MAVLVLAAAASLGLVACSGSSPSGVGQLTGTGVVEVTPIHGDAHLVHTGYTFHASDTVQVESGEASIQLPSGGTVQLRPSTSLMTGSTLRLVVGAILVQPAGHGVRVSTPQATLVIPSGAAQLTVTPGGELGVKVYQATSQIDLPGSSPVSIAAPRQVVLTSKSEPPLPIVPLDYQASDAWDRMYLAQAEQISGQVAAAVNGLNAQIPAADSQDVAFYQQLLPELNGRSDFVAAFDAIIQQQMSSASMAGDYLMASIIAVRATRGSLQDRLTGELAFLAQGAPWGFVAYDQGVTDLAGVLEDLLGAIGRATLPFSGSSPQIALPAPPTTTPTTVPPTRTPTSTPTSTPPVTTSTTLPPSKPANPSGPTTTTAPPLVQLPVPLISGTLGNILNPLLDPIIQTLNNILAGKG